MLTKAVILSDVVTTMQHWEPALERSHGRTHEDETFEKKNINITDE